MVGLHTWMATALKAGAAFGALSAVFLQPYRMMMFVGSSMEPTYHNYSLLLTEPVSRDQLKRGMVVIVNTASGPIVKRIAYLPGDSILQAKAGSQWYDMILVKPLTKESLSRLKWRHLVVPQGAVFLLGDNMTVSFDSRSIGCISMNEIERRPVDQRPLGPPENMPAPIYQTNRKLSW